MRRPIYLIICMLVALLAGNPLIAEESTTNQCPIHGTAHANGQCDATKCADTDPKPTLKPIPGDHSVIFKVGDTINGKTEADSDGCCNNVKKKQGDELATHSNLKNTEGQQSETKQVCGEDVTYKYTVINVSIDEIAATPNNALALKNEYIAQTGTVEVLKDWKVRYKGSSSTATPAGATFKWERKSGTGDWTSFGTGKTLEYTEAATGEFSIRFVVTSGGKDVVSTTRTVKVITTKVDSFSLVQGGEYKLNGGALTVPTAGITMNGKVSKDQGPTVSKIKWGFIQEIRSPLGTYTMATWPMDTTTWQWLQTTAGTNAVYFERIVAKRSSAAAANDAPANHYLYGLSTAKALGSNGSAIDTPGKPNPTTIPIDFKNTTGTTTTAKMTFKLETSTYKYVQDFTVWLVVLNTETNQYVPFKQQNWKLHLDATTGTSWKCQPIGSTANASSKPSDGSSTSSDSSKTIAPESVKTITHPVTP